MLIETDNYFTLREAADTLGVVSATLSVSILRSRLRAISPLGSSLVEKPSLEEYRARRESGTGRGRPKQHQVREMGTNGVGETS